MNEYRHLELKEPTNARKDEYKYFVGTTLKNPLEYKPFEKMVFKIRVKHKDDYLDIPYVSCYLTSDDGQRSESFIEKGEDGWFYIEASISKAGFVYLTAKACDENKQLIEDITPFNGSAGADVQSIFPAAKRPDDYDEFWAGLLREVENTAPEVLYCERVGDPESAYEMYDMRIKAPRSEYVSVAVAYPKGAEKNSLKAVFTFQAYGVGTAAPKPMKGYLSVVIGAHCLPNGQPREFYTNLRDNEMKGYGYNAEENSDPSTSYWTKMILRDLQAIRFFRDHELLNKEDYYFVGSSQGGMQACNMAARFDRASTVILNVPWLADIYGCEIAGRRKNTMPRGRGVIYFDTAFAAGEVKGPVYMISGLGDIVCNSGTQMALFNSIKGPKYIEFYQNKIHSCSIPWDKNVYSLGDESLAGKFFEHTEIYYQYD